MLMLAPTHADPPHLGVGLLHKRDLLPVGHVGDQALQELLSFRKYRLESEAEKGKLNMSMMIP